MDYHSLNAMLNLYDTDGKIQFDKDRESARQYFLQHVNQNMVYFHSFEERMRYLLDNDYYERELTEQYSTKFIEQLTDEAYALKFRFPAFLGAFKFFTSYALKTFDGKRYLERFEDRVVMVSLGLAQGDQELARGFMREMISGRFQPATPTFLNMGKAQRGELVSCFLLRVEDNMESISRGINSSLQLSKRGGGVALSLSNIREAGAPIKKIENQSSGIIPVMKLLEDSFSYANQLGARQGAGAVYLSAHHPDIMKFLDTKRENADEKIRIKTLSLGVVVPDITFELAKKNEDMYLFSPYDVERVYGVPFGDLSVTEHYYDMVNDSRISKTKISARHFFQTVAELQFESGYPYIVFEDTVNKANPIKGRINMSNLCVSGDTRLLTDSGYQAARDLYESQSKFQAIVDTRARDMNLATPGVAAENSTPMHLTAELADIFKLTTAEGFELRATEWHKMYVVRDGELMKIPLNEVLPGDRVLVQSGEGAFGDFHNTELAYITGALAADGTFAVNENTSSARLYLYGPKREFAEQLEAAAATVLHGREDLIERQSTLTPEFTYSSIYKRAALQSAPLAKLLAEFGVTRETKTAIPEFVLRGDRDTQVAYLTGFFQLEGSVTGSNSAGSMSIEASSTDRKGLMKV
nr:ribonucleotide reductase N-terminal alpha domain-containing protein [Leucobacter luti]